MAVSPGFCGPAVSTEGSAFQNPVEKVTCIPKLTWMWKPPRISPTAASAVSDLKLELNQCRQGSTKQRMQATVISHVEKRAASYNPQRRATVGLFRNDKMNSPRAVVVAQPPVFPQLATRARQQKTPQLGPKCLRFSTNENFEVRRTKQSVLQESKMQAHSLRGRPSQRMSVLSQSTIETVASLSQNDPRRTGISNATLKRQAARSQQEYKEAKLLTPTAPVYTTPLRGHESQTFNALTSHYRHVSSVATTSTCTHPQLPESMDDSRAVIKPASMLQGRRGSIYSDAHTSYWDGRCAESISSNDSAAAYTPDIEASHDDVSMSAEAVTSVQEKLDEISKLETAIANQKTGLETSRLLYLSLLDIIAGEATDWYPRLRPIVKKMIYGRIDEPIRLASLIEHALAGQ